MVVGTQSSSLYQRHLSQPMSLRPSRLEGSMRITPTNACPSLILEGEDYGLKVSINVHSQSGVRAMQVSGPLEHDVMRLQGLIADEHYR